MNKNLTFKKGDITFDITTRAENVRLNDSNVKDEIDNINRKIESFSIGEDGGIIVDNTEHNLSKINSEDGAHNFRFHDNKFSHKNEIGEWEDIEIAGAMGGNGGIKLPPTKFIEILSNDTSVTVKWEDADNQTLNGATISIWAGTKLIRKQDAPPLNENDGEVLVDNTDRDYYKLNGFVDGNISNDTIYYYALFPYDQNGVYNYDILNIRKFYRQSESVPANTTTIRVLPDIKSIKLLWTDGLSTNEATWAGTRVVRKIGAPPSTETDGTLILDNTNRDKYRNTYFIDDTATQNVEYFYGFFPYSREGHYNTNIENVASAVPATGKIYTLSINMDNSSPSGACTYLDDAVNISVGNAWDRTDIFQIKPCLFKDGQVNYYLNKDDYTKKIDGTPSNLSGVDGDVMVEIPFICHKLSRSGNIFNISLSTDKNLIKSNLGYTAYAFYDVDNNIADKIYVGVYQATIENGELFSNSGKNANVKYSLNQIFDACRARGRNYLPYSFMIHQLLVFLYMMRFRTRSPFENLTLSTNTWKNETGVFNQNGMWFKSDGGKFAGIEWAISSSYLYLAGAKLSSDVSGTVYRQNIVILEPRNFYTVNVTQAGWLTKSQYSYYNNASGATNSQCSGFSGYTKYVDARNAIIMFPSSDQSGGSASTYFCSYMSGIPQTTANSDLVLCVHLYYSGAYKGFLNLCGAVNSTVSASYSTYLTYIKGESQQ